MKYLSLLITAALYVAPSTAFVSRNSASFVASRTSLNAKIDMTPEVEAAIAEVREAASAFGEETAGFANRECSSRFVCSRVLDHSVSVV
jgi:hypothetical protein